MGQVHSVNNNAVQIHYNVANQLRLCLSIALAPTGDCASQSPKLPSQARLLCRWRIRILLRGCIARSGSGILSPMVERAVAYPKLANTDTRNVIIVHILSLGSTSSFLDTAKLL